MKGEGRTITSLRRKLDAEDARLVRAMARRLSLARRIVRLKKRADAGILDRKREEEVIEKVAKLGMELGVPHHLSAQVWQAMMDEAKRSGAGSGKKVFAGMKVAIVGGSGGMGALFADALKRAGAEVSIISRSEKKGMRAAKRLEVGFAGNRASGFEDIVIVSVPLSETAGVCIATAEHMKRGALLVEISSLKGPVLKELRGKLPAGIEFLSVHPLFGPRVAGFAGQNFAVIKTKKLRLGDGGRAFLQGLKALGAQVFFVSAEKHDRAMATVQVMHYLAVLAMAEALLSKKIEKCLFTESFIETVRFLEGKRRRISGASVLILAKHPQAKRVRRQFARIVEKLACAGDEKVARRLKAFAASEVSE